MKFPLATPQTVDLVRLNNGMLSQFASELKLTAGTYAQVMVILADSTDALAASAQTAGAATNDEVDYFDTADVAHTAAAGHAECRPGHQHQHQPHGRRRLRQQRRLNLIGGAAAPLPPSGGAATTTSAIVDFDATRDLVPMSLSGQPAFVLNPHPHGYNAAISGTIQGSVSLTGVSAADDCRLSGRAGVRRGLEQLTAPAMSSSRPRRVGTDGTFILYPLSTASGAPTTYDLVIHGPAIQTVIIKSVPVTDSAPGSAAAVLGTLTLTPATPFLVNLNTTAPAAPTSSLVGFYQTLPLSSEVPYLVEVRAVDPTSGVFASDQELSGGSPAVRTATRSAAPSH